MARVRLVGTVFGAVILFLLVQLGALALIDPFYGADVQPVEDPDDPTNSLVYVGAILVATGFMLAAIKFDLEWIIRWAIILASGMLSWFVLAVIAPPVLIGGVNIIAVFGTLAVVGGLLVYPEWYVIDAAGVLMGAGAAGLFGITFGILPAVVLLVVLAVYDAISVYGTEHMLTLAEGVMDQRVPVLLVIPVSLSFTMLDGADGMELDDDEAAGDNEPTEDGEPTDDDQPTEDDEPATNDESDDAASDVVEASPLERNAIFIGLGDAVIPTVLVASAAFFAPAPHLDVPGIAINVPALGAMIGTLIGLVALLALVVRGRAHAGLPLLNGGAISGYAIGALVAGIPITTAFGL